MDPLMRTIIGLFTVLSVCALSQAMATDPPAEAAKAAPSTSAASSPSSTTTDKTAAVATSADGTKQVKLVAGDADADARLKRLRAAGYKPEMHGKEVFFCRKEPLLGSRFEKKVCNTAEQLDAQMANGRDAVENAQRMGLGGGNPKGN
jgi:hypothetical protein